MVAWVASSRARYDTEIEHHYTAEQVALLWYLGKKDEFDRDERTAKLTAALTSQALAKALGGIF